ncbi:hypothetical protein LUZ60_010844 [Juncus effusus]|nr:hypothetical protein LUZ60_010844 [Juncus effusus]
MNKKGKNKPSFSGSEDFSAGAKHGRFQSDPGISRASNFTDRSNYTARTAKTDQSESSRKSFGRSFISCFIPSRNKMKEDNDIDHAITEEDFDVSSNSISKKSVASNNSSLYKLRRSDSDSQNSIQQVPTQFSIREIYRATSNFNDGFRIGQGGFGTVYKGKLRDGTLIAVKRAKKVMYDQQLSAEFRSEIETLSKVEHSNLVRFLGYLEHEDERIIVVEYVNNGSLRGHLDGVKGDSLGILQRLNVATDVAHAIAYLHEYADHPIIHRDIKASNILLTDSLRAKVADFGFARLAPDDPEATHISTQVKGTAGYVDPEYLRTYQLSEKSDVYSFGVVLVELVTGRRPIERGKDRKERMTTNWALRKYKEGDVVIAMDARLRRNPATVTAVEKMLRLAEECVIPSRKSRPSMRKCAEELWAIRRDFQQYQQQQQQYQVRRVADSTVSKSSNTNTSSFIREE